MKRVDVTYAVIFDDTGEQILLVKNIGETGSYYTLPGGAVEQGETLEEAVIREVKEETNLDIEVGEVFSIAEAFFQKKQEHAVFFTFSGKVIGGDVQVTVPEEIEEIVWMTVQEAEAFINFTIGSNRFEQKSVTVPYIKRGLVK
ncbi:NUDIX hydrolase [Alkalihalobacillus pseudalcaliphilus]|uniref:NUDIX hydrolase n=1 Tax=Alkalihalobacillus pseudalcaliphilus TaxID=79884 RepID=UPI00064DB163|nr:NUDIX hydrolase [Alkalihalobacillus pseudalcaliphilus]KMK75558.1 DNA mismatch repair protein MutT [Alkalihalobacillus pseudalcaliphilus]